jgi:hypothetical protein
MNQTINRLCAKLNSTIKYWIQRINADGTVCLFIYNVGFINDVKVIKDANQAARIRVREEHNDSQEAEEKEEG